MKMKSVRFWTIGLIGSLLFMAGCESEFVPPDGYSNKLTIIAHPYPGEGNPRAYIYSSLSPLDTSQFNTPSHIVVEITELETDVSHELDSVREGGLVYWEFPSDFLKESFTYSIKAFAPGFEPVSAKTKIPTPSKLTNLLIKDVRIEPSTKIEFKNIVHYKVEFNIEKFETNPYYHLIFKNKYAGNPNLYPLEPELSDNIKFVQNYDIGILIDGADLKDGEPLVFNFVDWTVGNETIERIYVELRTVTADYYKYNSTLAQQVIARDDPFHEPITIFNNIEGGFGNFSGFSPNISSSELPH
jgi:hypothetical protein